MGIVHSTTEMLTLSALSLHDVPVRPGGLFVFGPSPRTQTGAYYSIVLIVDCRIDVTSGATENLQNLCKACDIQSLHKVIMSTNMLELLFRGEMLVFRTSSTLG